MPIWTVVTMNSAHVELVTSCALSQYVGIGSDGILHLHDLETGKVCGRWHLPKGSTGIALTEDDSIFAIVPRSHEKLSGPSVFSFSLDKGNACNAKTREL